MGRIGLFGGTFDPPHVGHVTVARDLADALALDRVIWMPAGEPPHKVASGVSPKPVRLEMTRAAAGADPRFEVGTVEVDRPGPSFTVDTLQRLSGLHPGDDLFLILGADQFRALAAWHEPRRLGALATFAVMDRAGESARDRVPDVPGAERAVFVPVRRVDVSSSQVRDLVRAGKSVEGLLPPGVGEIIERERLYRDPSGAREE